MRFQTTLDFGAMGEQNVNVHYRHHKGYQGSCEQPPEYSWCELLRVEFLGHCIMNLLSEDALAELQSDALENWEE